MFSECPGLKKEGQISRGQCKVDAQSEILGPAAPAPSPSIRVSGTQIAGSALTHGLRIGIWTRSPGVPLAH